MNEPSPERRRLRSLLGLLVACLLVTPCDAEPKAPELRRDWREMKTPHFVIFGDAPEKKMKTVASSLESLSSFLGQMASGEVEAPVPTFVYVFRNRRSFEPYEARRFDGKPRGIAGFYMNRSHANYIVIDGSRSEALGAIAQHEYVHFFNSYRLPPIPLWFNEGLAEFYSTFEVKRDQINVGKIIPHHLQWLKQNSLIPLVDFLSVTHWSPEYYDEGSRRGVFYAQSWALVHYLFLEAEGGRAGLAKFLQLQNTLPTAEAFKEAFGVEAAEMELRLRRYIRSKRFTYRQSEQSEEAKEPTMTVRTLSKAEALARLGELLAVQDVFRFKQADAHFQAALALDKDEVVAHVGLGLGQLHARTWGDPEEMVAHFARAKALAPTDRRISYLLALGQAWRGDPPADLRPAVTALINSNPRFLGAWKLLAWSWAEESENLEGAIRVFEEAHRLFPDERAYAEHLHRLYSAVGRSKDAEHLVEDFFKPRDREPASAPKTPPLP